MARQTPGPNILSFQDLFAQAFTLATLDGKPALAVTAPDGSALFATGGAVTQSGTWTVQPGNTANTTPWLVNSGNPTNHALPSAAATTNPTSVKATAGNLLTLNITNMSAAPKFIKLYDKASAPTVGTDIPVDTIEVAANSYRSIPFGNNGIRFALGIAYALTGAQPDADTTALAAGDAKVHLAYI